MEGGWQLVGQVISLGISCSVVASVWIPRARIVAGLLLGGLAIAVAVLTAWRQAGGHEPDLAPLLAITAGLGLAGTMLFLWGQRTTETR